MEVDEIYNILRENFHSQSGLFLNKGQAYEVAQIIKEKSMISELQRSVNFEREDHPYSAEVVHGVNKRKREMKAILEFNLPEDSHEFEMATQGASMHSVLWEMDQWLRAQYKYMPDNEYSADKYETYEKCREHLRELMFENGVKFD